jgi:16S rRNA (cytosine1402-N4)-methyltransferase
LARIEERLILSGKGQSSGHEPVLCGPVVAYLTEGRSGLYLDATFGGGGHTRALLEADAANRVIALDCDPEAIARGQLLQEDFPGRLSLRHMNFEDLGHLEEEGFAGILFDFGVSSYHFDDAHRGFSFREDAPLDMRLNPRAGVPASVFLQRAGYEELVEAVRTFGEEPKWRRVVEAILEAQGTDQLERTLSFAALVETAVGGRRHTDRIHPATRTFQGIRIAVNRELAVIEAALPAAFAKLAEGGRLAAISFHSLEDRIVKRFFRRMAGRPEHGRDSRPGQFRLRQAALLTRKPVVADDQEITRNPRSRSAKLRVLEKERRAA